MSGKVKRCYNCDSGNKSDKESLEVCKDCGLPYQRKNWKPLAESISAEKEKLKCQIKTAYRKGLRHFAKALKDYDKTDGAWTDYFEHTVDEVLQKEQEKLEGLGTTEDQLAKATELLKKVIKVTWGEGWNYSLDVKVESEQFLKECEK